MLEGNKILAIIPARGGSKGIQRKNIRKLSGQPLISYAIKEALKSNYIDRVIVSTEDLEIANISKSFGAEVPFFRPNELAQDDTPGIEPIIHAVNFLKKEEQYSPDYVMCLQCTSPFRTSIHIDEAIEMLITKKLDSLVSVNESEISPYWMKNIVDGKLVNFIEESQLYSRRQDLPKVYRLNGAIYMAKTEVLINNKNWYTNDTIPYIMGKIASIDIDDEIDFKFAEFLLKTREKDSNEDTIRGK